LREKELDAAARARERALSESQEHLRALLRVLERDRTTLSTLETRIADLQAQVENYRRQLARVITRAVNAHRTQKIKVSLTRPAQSTKVKQHLRAPNKMVRRRSPKGRPRSLRRSGALSRTRRAH
jgi:septal ring factor EnvC (AmiA/AmiB activator)